MKNYFHDMKNDFHDMTIYFHAVKKGSLNIFL